MSHVALVTFFLTLWHIRPSRGYNEDLDINYLFSLKMAERSEAKSAKRSFASKCFKFKFFSLRSAIFIEKKEDNLMVSLLAWVKARSKATR
jgi:hypothetical protein